MMRIVGQACGLTKCLFFCRAMDRLSGHRPDLQLVGGQEGTRATASRRFWPFDPVLFPRLDKHSTSFPTGKFYAVGSFRKLKQT